MARILTVLLISSVFVFGLCKEDSKEHKKLNLDIKKTREKITSVNEDNAKLSEQIHQETKLYKSKIRINDDLKNKGSAENKKQQEELEDLYRQLVQSYFEEDVLKEAPMNIEKLKLSIKVTQEDIKMLEKRRENGDAKLCMKLEGMVKNVDEPSKISVLTTGRIIDDSIVLENKLRLALTELDQANNKNAELKMQLKSLNDFYNRLNKDLNEAIKQLGEDNKEGQERIEKIKKALEEQKTRMAELEKSSRANMEELEKWKKEAKKVLDKIRIYALDVECYKKLHNDMVTLVTPKP